MTKKELETHNRLLDLLEANTKTMERLLELTTVLNKPVASPNGGPPEAPTVEPTPPPVVTPPPPVEKIGIEYCRKALVKIASITSDEDARDWLHANFDVRTLPELPEGKYEDFISQARELVIKRSK